MQTSAHGVCVWLCSQGSAFPAAGQNGLGLGVEDGHTGSGCWGCAQSIALIPVAASRPQDVDLHSCLCNRSITERNLSMPVTLKLCCCTTAYAETLTLPWKVNEVSGGLVLVAVLPPKMCFCCTVRICLWGDSYRGTTFIFFPCVFMLGRIFPVIEVSTQNLPMAHGQARRTSSHQLRLVSYRNIRVGKDLQERVQPVSYWGPVWSPTPLECGALWGSYYRY